MTCFEESCIKMQEDNKRDLSFILHEYITHKTINSLSPERIFVGFMEAIENLINMDNEDYADRSYVHDEWVVNSCWERMHPLYKEKLIAAFPDIDHYMLMDTLELTSRIEFHLFKFNIFKRITTLERAEIIKRAQIKSLKEEIVMKAMNPDRIERLINLYGIDEVMESF